jgi:proteasome lid subunit RPN8/RPN11
MEHSAEIALNKWSVPECSFEIEYSARVLDDIRLAVVDAFFSLPRGGAEIGGILLGKWEDGRVSITGFEPLDCEHALGPSFTLSPRDQTQLSELIGMARRNGPDRQPVGWYHSHTRSEILLSDADLSIHHRFFPEPWQVALVLKPHTFEPTRGGFFFCEPGGSMRSKASYQEFRLDAMPIRPGAKPSLAHLLPVRQSREDSVTRGTLVGTPAPAAAPAPPPIAIPDPPKPKGRVPITREIPVEPPVAEPHPPEEPPAYPTPSFGQSGPARPWRLFKVAAILAIGLAIGGCGYETREYWLPWTLAKIRAVLPHEPNLYLALFVADDNGQLKIQWDRNAPAVRNALDGALEITDGHTVPQSVRLDSAHLVAGTFTYARQAERVDVTLIVSEPAGQMVKEQTSFLGRLPMRKPAVEDPQTANDRNADAERADKLQKDLNFQAAKARKLEKALKDMQEQLEKSKQTPEGAKKN